MNFIINPENNESYNIFSNKGKHLLKQYVNYYNQMGGAGQVNTTGAGYFKDTDGQFRTWSELSQYGKTQHKNQLNKLYAEKGTLISNGLWTINDDEIINYFTAVLVPFNQNQSSFDRNNILNSPLGMVYKVTSDDTSEVKQNAWNYVYNTINIHEKVARNVAQNRPSRTSANVGTVKIEEQPPALGYYSTKVREIIKQLTPNSKQKLLKMINAWNIPRENTNEEDSETNNCRSI